MLLPLLFFLMMIPVSHTADTAHCDIDRDKLVYPEMLKNDPAVLRFTDEFPLATTQNDPSMLLTLQSLPAQADLPYYHTYRNGTELLLNVHVVDCVDAYNASYPNIYTLAIKHADERNFRMLAHGEDGISAFLADYRHDWINVRGEVVSVFPASVGELVKRGYLAEPLRTEERQPQ